MHCKALKEKQERSKLKREKRLQAQEERKLKESKQVKKSTAKILTFVVQLTIAAFLVMMIVYYIF